MTTPRLHRSGAPPRIRLVHFGLGAFHRAHQAVYTQLAAPADDWGIAAFTGRSAAPAALVEQEGVYTVVTPDEDALVVDRIATVASGSDRSAFRSALAALDVSAVTLTITEAGYAGPDADPDVRADIARLRNGDAPLTAPGRLVDALQARRAAQAGPVTVLSCDNVPRNGARIRSALLAIAADVDESLATWIADELAFPSSVVDRITPRPGDDAARISRTATGFEDQAAVLAEPYREWVIENQAVSELPDWASAGARFVDDVDAAESRKLRLLNAGHLLLALEGPARGVNTVAEAWADAELRASVERLWGEARRSIPEDGADIEQWLARVAARFADPRIEHHLAQIAEGVLEKLRVRIVPTVDAEMRAGRSGDAALRVVAAWLQHQDASMDESLRRLGSWTENGLVKARLASLLQHESACGSALSAQPATRPVAVRTMRSHPK